MKRMTTRKSAERLHLQQRRQEVAEAYKANRKKKKGTGILPILIAIVVLFSVVKYVASYILSLQ